MLVVLGIDSLDGERVTEFETPHLDLSQNGVMHTFDDLDSGELRTHILWPSMVIGKHPSDIFPGYPYPTGEGQGTVDWNVDMLNNSVVAAMDRTARRVFPTRVKKVLSEMIGSSDLDRERPHQRHESLFDVADNANYISIPNYNEDESNTELKNLLTASNSDTTVSAAEFESTAAGADANRMFRTLNAVRSRNHDLVFTHLFSLDPIQHVFATDTVRMARWHRWYDGFVEQLTAELKPDDTVVIVSDHGMRTDGMHSKRAYFASSEPIWDTDEFRMVELRDVLEEELAQHSVETADSSSDDVDVDDQTMDHLDALGYT